jgi:oligopeptide transport system ATP-binding protein
MSPQPLLSVRDITVTFRLKKQHLSAVRGLSFDLYPKEILGIVGESGSGKSAMAKALIGLLPSHCTLIQGEVLYGGQNLLHLSEKQLQKIRGREIGMIFQDPLTSLNPTKKIGPQISESYLHHHKTATHAEAYDRTLELLHLVGILHPKERAEAYPHMLSGGMRQRVMIALALAAQPALIIADEPTTALDVTIQAQILDLLQSIKEKLGTSFILITHDLSVVAGFCDRVLVMYAGKIVEEAEVDLLFSAPQHPYTQGLLQSIPRLDMPPDQPLTPIEGSPPSLLEISCGCNFFPRCRKAFAMCKEKDPLLKQVSCQQHKAACFAVEKEKEKQ